jgi:hypothetical protein
LKFSKRDYTLGAYLKRGEDFENIGKNVRLRRRNSPKSQKSRCKRKTEPAKRKSAKRQKEKEKSGRGQKHGKKNVVLAGGLCFFLP